MSPYDAWITTPPDYAGWCDMCGTESNALIWTGESVICDQCADREAVTLLNTHQPKLREWAISHLEHRIHETKQDIRAAHAAEDTQINLFATTSH